MNRTYVIDSREVDAAQHFLQVVCVRINKERTKTKHHQKSALTRNRQLPKPLQPDDRETTPSRCAKKQAPTRSPWLARFYRSRVREKRCRTALTINYISDVDRRQTAHTYIDEQADCSLMMRSGKPARTPLRRGFFPSVEKRTPYSTKSSL